MSVKRHPQNAPGSRGGQFAASAHPDDQKLAPLVLGDGQYAASVPITKIRLGFRNKRCLLRNVDGRWVTNRPFEHEIIRLAQEGSGFREDTNEVMDYMARITADMLNAGDIDPAEWHQLQVVKQAVRDSGYAFGLKDAWRDIECRKLADRYDLLYASAYMRCGQYVLNEIKLSGQSLAKLSWNKDEANLVPNQWWEDGRLAHGQWFLAGSSLDGRWLGRDNGLLARYLELEIDGKRLLDASPRSMHSSKAAEWVSVFLAATTPPDHEWHQRARDYLRESADLAELRLSLRRILNPQGEATYDFGPKRYWLRDYQWDRRKARSALKVLGLIRREKETINL